MDSIDIAVWSLASYTPPDRYFVATFVGAPLAIEVGMRRGAVAFVVPAVACATTTLVRLLAGRAVLPLPFLWLVLAASCGVLLSRYDSRLRRQAHDEWSRRRSAEDRKAYVAGQNAVAMGASSVVDGIEGVLPILGTPTSGSALWQLADGWKAGLGASTRAEAAYLGQVLKEWATDHNRHPDLSSHVVLLGNDGSGTVLLTGTQEAALRRCLTELRLTGRHLVALVDPSVATRPPGGPFRLRLGDRSIEVPGDIRRPLREYDPGPATFVLFSLLSLGDVLGMRVPLPAATLCLSLFLVAAMWSHRRLLQIGKSARPTILLAAVAVAVTMTVVFSVSARLSTGPTGAGIYPVVAQMDLLVILGCMYRSELTRLALAVTVAGAAAVLAAAWILHDGVRRPFDLAVMLVWPACALVSAARYSRELEAAVTRHALDLAVDDDAATMREFQRGRAEVLDLVRQALIDAHAHLSDLRSTLPPSLYTNVLERLGEVDQRLKMLLLADGSSSSTTINSPLMAMPTP